MSTTLLEPSPLPAYAFEYMHEKRVADLTAYYAPLLPRDVFTKPSPVIVNGTRYTSVEEAAGRTGISAIGIQRKCQGGKARHKVLTTTGTKGKKFWTLKYVEFTARWA